MPQPVSWTPRKLTTLSKYIPQARRDRVANNTRTGKRNGIIAEAIAETKKQLVSEGQENISPLQDYLSKKRDPASAQFTFTCDSQVPGALAWPAPDRRTSNTAQAHQALSARQGGDNWSRNTRASQNDAPPAAPLDAEAASKEASSQNSVAGQDPVAAQKAARRSLASGVFSAAQAERGRAVYAASCAACHGADFTPAQGAPPVQGAAFLANWRGRTLAELMAKVRTMPPGAADSLSEADHLATLAYILQANGFPSGGQPLSADPAALREIGFGD